MGYENRTPLVQVTFFLNFQSIFRFPWVILILFSSSGSWLQLEETGLRRFPGSPEPPRARHDERARGHRQLQHCPADCRIKSPIRTKRGALLFTCWYGVIPNWSTLVTRCSKFHFHPIDHQCSPLRIWKILSGDSSSKILQKLIDSHLFAKGCWFSWLARSAMRTLISWCCSGSWFMMSLSAAGAQLVKICKIFFSHYNRRNRKLWFWTARWRHIRKFRQTLAKLLKEVNFFIYNGYSNFTYVKQ